MTHVIGRTVARFLSNNSSSSSTGLISQVGRRHLPSSSSCCSSSFTPRSVTPLSSSFTVSRSGSVRGVASRSSVVNTGTVVVGSRSMGNEQKPKIVFVLGAPGAGKGTQCEKIVEQFGFTHLSAGDLLREERKREGSEFGALIEDNIRNGRIVPVEITCSLLENAINATKASTGNNKFLIDGFPRNEDNLQGWNRQMGDKVQLLFVLFFECTEEQCVARCLKRGESSGRSDDNPESLKKRFGTYINDTMPIVDHYRAQNLVKTIDAVAGPDEVFEKVRCAFADVE